MRILYIGVIFPWQLSCCGALLCRWCLLRGLSNSEPFTCPLCGTKQPEKEGFADRAVANELKIVVVVCYSCIWKGSYGDYLGHLQEQHADLECADCRQRFFAINAFEEHRQELCAERSILCGLPNCSSPIKWYHMKSHYLNNQHQRTLVKICSEFIQLRSRQAQNRNDSQEYTDLMESIGLASSTHEIIRSDYARLQMEIGQTRTNTEQNVSKAEELKKQDKENENKLKEHIEQVNGDLIMLDNIKRTREEIGTLILDTKSTTVLPLPRPTTSSFSINSPKFKTSQYGCIFMTRLCSTIDGNGEYLSLLLSLLNGEYYNLIPFPFSYDIHIALWDQSNQQKHVVHVIKPDPASPHLLGQLLERNEEYGVIKFCPLQYLTDAQSIYVRDEIFFLKVFVDF